MRPVENNCHLFFETLGTKLKTDLLLQLREKPQSVVELAKELGEERSKVSHALLSLLECNFVRVEENGKNRIYSLNKDTILPLLNLVEKHMKNYCKICKKI
ncbi:MAG: helix-turn-helix domain-containing protein [Candidatus Staskawiczbacteria bacterium]|nr:helix-turn-helix domain-containing protein [Candidatus Staskawiczbacteria bacterium]